MKEKRSEGKDVLEKYKSSNNKLFVFSVQIQRKKRKQCEQQK